MNRLSVLFFIGIMLLGGSESFAKEEQEQPPVYRLYPDFVTNLYSQNRAKFLMIRVEVMAKNHQQVKMIEHHEPLLRNAVLDIFNNTSSTDFKNYNKREQLREQVITAMNKLLNKEMGEDPIVDLMFSKITIE